MRQHIEAMEVTICQDLTFIHTTISQLRLHDGTRQIVKSMLNSVFQMPINGFAIIQYSAEDRPSTNDVLFGF